MQEIELLRAEMDKVHIEISQLLQKRLAITKKIWQIKKEQNLPMLDLKREETILQKISMVSNETEEQKFLIQVFKNILIESKKYLGATLK